MNVIDGEQNDTQCSRSVILICAYAADPNIPSEPTIGWSFVQSALRATVGGSQRVVLLTNARSGEAMRQWSTESGLDDRLEIVAVGLGKGLRWLERPRINVLARLEYVFWYFAASRAVRAIAATYEISLAHHVTFATEMLPTPIVHAGKDSYKVWGPIGSDGSAAVFKIKPLLKGTRREYLIQKLRDSLSTHMAHLFRRDINLVITSQRGRLYSAMLRSNVNVLAFPNLVLPSELVEEIRNRVVERATPRKRSNAAAIEIMCVGHLIPRKRFELAIAMLGEEPLKEATLHFFGSATGGALRPYLQMVREAGVSERVFFHGKVPRAEVMDFMAQADVLFHPAGREGAVGVIGEATTAGIPVVCFNNTGAALVLRAAGGAGCVIDAESEPSLAEIAGAVANAAAMERAASADWRASRFDELERELIQHASSSRQDVDEQQRSAPSVIKGA